MLLKNDVIYKLSDEDIAAVYKKLGWKKGAKNKPANFKIPEEQYVFDAANNRKVRPTRIHIPLQEKEDNENEGTIKWNYCERPPSKNEKGEFVYDRKVYPMTGDFELMPDKIELVWFLLFKSSVRKPNTDEFGNLEKGEKPINTRACFYVQNKVGEAKAKLAKRELKSEIESLILGKNAWPEATIRKYAIAFGCEVADDDTIFEVKANLLGRLEGTRTGYQDFAALTNSEKDVDLLFVVSNAVKKGAIGFNSDKNAWMFKSEGKFGTKICNAKGSMSKEMSLVTFLQDNPDVQSAIEMACL